MSAAMMLSPKMQRMQRSVRINDGQLVGLAEKAKFDSRLVGYLYKRCSDSSKWLLRWFRLYQVRLKGFRVSFKYAVLRHDFYYFQNLLFYYDNEHSNRPIGAIFLEGCYCERLLNPTHSGKDETIEKIVSLLFAYVTYPALFKEIFTVSIAVVAFLKSALRFYARLVHLVGFMPTQFAFCTISRIVGLLNLTFRTMYVR